jgi:hypothetical protein
MHALGVLVELGATGAPSGLDHLRHLSDQLLGQGADPIGFGQRAAGVEQDIDRQGALVEGGQKGPRKKGHRGGGDRDRQQRGPEQQPAECRNDHPSRRRSAP